MLLEKKSLIIVLRNRIKYIMIIIDAFWEKRNLGIDVIEVTFDGNENISEAKSALHNLNYQYCVLKIPVGKIELLWAAQELGYRMIETGIELEAKTNNMDVPSLYKRFKPFLTIGDGDEIIRNHVLDTIRSGSIFATDRIALDPLFSREMAGERYYNWVNDELERGARLVIAYYKDNPIGFGVNKNLGNNVYDAFLGGILPDAANKGLGFAALYANYVSISKQGGVKIVTRVSSNNPPILRLHMQYGYVTTSMNYVLVKHQ